MLGGPLPVGRWYRFHPVAWDSLCSLPMPWLERMLLAYHEHDRSAATDEIERLITEYPSQRNAAIRAKLRLLAREAATSAT